MVRPSNLADLKALEDSALFPLRNLRGRRVILQRSVEEEGKLVGSFLLSETTELSLILAANASRFERLKALKEVAKELEKELRWRGIPETHCFVNDRIFAQLLVQHFNFEYCLGRSLVWRDNGKRTNPTSD